MLIRNRVLDPTSRPWVMGVLNVTPDSFSDGGAYLDSSQAVARAREMIAEGVDVIDVGPESTRPGAEDVPCEEQLRRAIPVIRAIRQANNDVAVSIDTRLGAVARAALEAGADMINDTSALRDDLDMPEVTATFGAAVVLMHRRGTPKDMQAGGGPWYQDVVGEVCAFFQERLQFAERAGISRDRILLDPGIGFGKRVEHNLLILRELKRFVELGRPVLVGASRKRFLGTVLGADDPRNRAAASLACAAIATLAGAGVIRTHDVRSTVDVVRTSTAVRDAGMRAEAS